MVLVLKHWKSRSLPAFVATVHSEGNPFTTRDGSGRRQSLGAGWSSPVARQAHNLKVVGSNPTPAPTKPLISLRKSGAFLLSECAEFSKSASSPQFLKRIPQVWTAAARARMPDRSQGSIRTDRGNVAAS